MSSTTIAKSHQETQNSDLDGRYRQIGISAVAAALRYQSDGKNPAYAPIEPEPTVRCYEVDAAA
jgi:hypothetical protein